MSEANCGLFSRTTVFLYVIRFLRKWIYGYYTRIVPKCYLILYYALYLDILFYIHDDISLLRLWNQDLPYIYNSLSSSSCFHLLDYLQLLLYLFQHQITHSCRVRAIYLWIFFFFYYKTNILVRELHLTCLSMEWFWNEGKLSIQILLL